MPELKDIETPVAASEPENGIALEVNYNPEQKVWVAMDVLRLHPDKITHEVVDQANKIILEYLKGDN